MQRHIIALILLFPSLAWADCITVDTSSWTQNQKSMRQAVAYRLAFASGIDEIPTIEGDKICFSAQVSSALASGNLLTGINADLAQAASDKAALEANRASASTERADSSTNDVCSASSISTVNTKIQTIHDNLDAQIQSVGSLAAAKAVLANLNDAYATGLAKIARCAWAANKK